MNVMGQLFEHRKLSGSRLESALNDHNMTKAKLCKVAGFSRPTLDKLLAGDIHNEDNFTTYMTKALAALSMTPDVLLSGVSNPYVQIKLIRNLVRTMADDLAEKVGISADRLKEIENGGEATNAELCDIAMLLGTGVDDLLGENPFSTHIATMDDFLDNDKKSTIEPSGFWGHVGILPKGSKEYSWFPISAAAYRRVCEQMTNERLVIPCMNNKLLYINTRNMKSILMLDDACDAPGFTNWDQEVSEGEIPAVVYECYEDYLYADHPTQQPDPEEYSEAFWKCLQEFGKKYNWNEDSIFDVMDAVCIHYDDGSIAKTNIVFDDFETVSGAVDIAYNLEFYDGDEPFIQFEDFNGTVIYLNTDTMSFMELPLVKTQRAIIESNHEL